MQFSSCLASGKYAAEVQKDFADGQAAGVSGTPTIFLNGQAIIGAQPYSVFEQAIEKELAGTR
ncbi:thioredoxin domain-containing protein, partial [Candidatus Azambacteria bacterium]|nr:thioredoxin domain-containing protein [Candidatus Azambacteria bacterium]